MIWYILKLIINLKFFVQFSSFLAPYWAISVRAAFTICPTRSVVTASMVVPPRALAIWTEVTDGILPSVPAPPLAAYLTLRRLPPTTPAGYFFAHAELAAELGVTYCLAAMLESSISAFFNRTGLECAWRNDD